jgi:hypothetical protein
MLIKIVIFSQLRTGWNNIKRRENKKKEKKKEMPVTYLS